MIQDVWEKRCYAVPITFSDVIQKLARFSYKNKNYTLEAQK